MNCPLCHATSQFAFRVSDVFYKFTDYEAELHKCTDCGVLFQVPLPDRNQAAQFYGSGYWQETKPSGLVSSLQRVYVRFLMRADLMGWVQRMRLKPQARVVDVGCSRGDWLLEMRARGLETQGVEGDLRAVQHARDVHKLNVIHSDLEDWCPEPQSIDAITCFHVLEHLTDPKGFLLLCHQALRQPGVLLIRVPNIDSWQGKWFKEGWKGLEPPRHLINFTPKALLGLLDECGFEIHRWSTWSWRDGPPAWSSSLLPTGEPTYQLVHGRKNTLKQLMYLGLTTLITPLERWAAILQKGGMITVLAEKRSEPGLENGGNPV